MISELISDELNGLIDVDKWDSEIEIETSERKALEDAAKRWPDVEKFLRGKK